MSAFAPRGDKKQVEEGLSLSPKFDADGLIPAIATDHVTGEVLMLAFMNEVSLLKTIETGEAHYWSRSRKKLWHKGEESGHVQKVVQMLTDCDQDMIVMRVEQIGGACCHVGYRSCCYREIPIGSLPEGEITLKQAITEKVFDPDEVYGKK